MTDIKRMFDFTDKQINLLNGGYIGYSKEILYITSCTYYSFFVKNIPNSSNTKELKNILNIMESKLSKTDDIEFFNCLEKFKELIINSINNDSYTLSSFEVHNDTFKIFYNIPNLNFDCNQIKENDKIQKENNKIRKVQKSKLNNYIAEIIYTAEKLEGKCLISEIIELNNLSTIKFINKGIHLACEELINKKVLRKEKFNEFKHIGNKRNIYILIENYKNTEIYKEYERYYINNNNEIEENIIEENIIEENEKDNKKTVTNKALVMKCFESNPNMELTKNFISKNTGLNDTSAIKNVIDSIKRDNKNNLNEEKKNNGYISEHIKAITKLNNKRITYLYIYEK